MMISQLKKYVNNEPTILIENANTSDPASEIQTFVVSEYYYGEQKSKRKAPKRKIGLPFNCFDCKKKLTGNLRFMKHGRHKLENRLKKVGLSKSLFHCWRCYAEFSSEHELDYHYANVHTKNNTNTCRICERDYKDDEEYLFHMKETHVVCETPYQCDICHFKTSMMWRLTDHFKKAHTDSQNLLCYACCYVTKDEVDFITHCMAHSIHSHRCTKCRLMFISEVELQKHLSKDHVPGTMRIGRKRMPRNLNKCLIVLTLPTASDQASDNSRKIHEIPPSDSPSELVEDYDDYESERDQMIQDCDDFFQPDRHGSGIRNEADRLEVSTKIDAQDKEFEKESEDSGHGTGPIEEDEMKIKSEVKQYRKKSFLEKEDEVNVFQILQKGIRIKVERDLYEKDIFRLLQEKEIQNGTLKQNVSMKEGDTSSEENLLVKAVMPIRYESFEELPKEEEVIMISSASEDSEDEGAKTPVNLCSSPKLSNAGDYLEIGYSPFDFYTRGDDDYGQREVAELPIFPSKVSVINVTKKCFTVTWAEPKYLYDFHQVTVANVNKPRAAPETRLIPAPEKSLRVDFKDSNTRYRVDVSFEHEGLESHVTSVFVTVLAPDSR